MVASAAAWLCHFQYSQVPACVEVFRARVVDATSKSFVFEVTGNVGKINSFIDLMRPLGLFEICRTGVAAIARGEKGV